MIELIFKHKARAYLIFWYAFLLVVHFFLKDRFLPLVFIFNACSLIFIITYGFLLSIGLYKFKKLSIFLLCFNSLIAVYWYNNYHFKTEDTSLNTTIKTHAVLYWNISRPDNLPLDVIFKNMTESNPEIIVLVEAKDIPKEDLLLFESHYPSYEIKQLEGEMMVAVKGKINTVEYIQVARGSKSNLVTATIQNKPYTFLVIDLLANPALSKKSEFRTLQTIFESQPIDFLVGDFNTTYESFNFNSFTSHFESFHKYNNGFTATWPSVFPILEIDHFWLSKKWKPIILHKAFHSDSDHALLMGKFQLKL